MLGLYLLVMRGKGLSFPAVEVEGELKDKKTEEKKEEKKEGEKTRFRGVEGKSLRGGKGVGAGREGGDSARERERERGAELDRYMAEGRL